MPRIFDNIDHQLLPALNETFKVAVEDKNLFEVIKADKRARIQETAISAEVIEKLKNRGIDLDQLRKVAKQPDADPFDLLCHLAFQTPLLTRRERATRFRQQQATFLAQYRLEARTILEELLQSYADHGLAQFKLPDALQIAPISDHGNLLEIAAHFGGPELLKQALEQLQTLLYAA